MSEKVRVRVLLAKFIEDTTPLVIAAIDHGVWENWEDEDETSWLLEEKDRFGGRECDFDYREVWVELDPSDLAAVFRVPVAQGTVVPSAREESQ